MEQSLVFASAFIFLATAAGTILGTIIVVFYSALYSLRK